MRTSVAYVAALFLLGLASAENDPNDDPAINSSSLVHDNELRPFEGRKSSLLRDWITVTNIDQNREIHIVEGQTLLLSCHGVSSRIPQVAWYKGNLRVADDTEGDSEENAIVPYGAIRVVQRFIVPCATVLHSGIYYCKGHSRGAMNESGLTNVVVHRTRPGTKSLGCKLTKGKARITYFVKFMMQVQGFDIVIPCKATGLPAPTITWSWIGHPAKESRFQVLENGDLFIPKLSWKDMGVYRCHASNEFGSDSHDTFVYPLKEEKK
ncbi:neural/ectodermal development factor IMP-L2 [Cimex lectularius]|uniref:Ig-like domain-containing protein n=1 Tax=Cimex lectularius TaxID=79782 RepID=A0A8I6RD87_CIMLE|nr:neural/ectodermal development factor IMP-L2 [Cimex lectularius]